MSAISDRTLVVALLGNPNTGKSTLFSALAGVRQRVGNYPGVTVEKKIGQATVDGKLLTLVDLPGTYSLAPRSPDEMVAVDVLLGRLSDAPAIDVVLAIVDASNLERNLYLVSQVLELGLPTVVALNMTDVARQHGIEIDVGQLRERLGVPVVETQANKRRGLDDLTAAICRVAGLEREAIETPFPRPFKEEVTRLESELNRADDKPIPRPLVERLLLDTSGYLEKHLLNNGRAALGAEIQAARQRLAECGCVVPAVEAVARYTWVSQVLQGVIKRPAVRPRSLNDSFDRVVTHRLWGTIFFIAMMLVVFQSVFRAAAYPMAWIEAATGAIAEEVQQLLPAGAFESLVVKGLIGGVGSVLVFVPQIAILFFFIAVLEDCGYMARAAYLMDKLMSCVGLSGKSFIPLLSSFACAIPGVMATRVIENRRDRLTTILVAPLMSCSARLPVYTLLIAAFIPDVSYAGGLFGLQGLTMTAMYLIGIVTAVVVALVLKRTLLRGPTPPFVMELPTYKWPSPATVGHRMLQSAWSFVHRAGTLVVAVSILVWAALYYPHNPEVVEAPFAARQRQIESRLSQLPADDSRRAALEDERRQLAYEIDGAYSRQSFLGRSGRLIEPAVRPLGWDWRIGSAAIASFPAREVVVATMGIIYNLGEDVDPDESDNRNRWQTALKRATWDGTDRPVFNIPVALSIMVFFALCAQCASTLVIIKRETNSWRWPAFTFIYMTVLAYLGAMAVYQVGMLLAG